MNEHNRLQPREVMANTTPKLAPPNASLKITPSNSPILRPGTRSHSKSAAHQSSLSLQTVIGTTTTTPNGFSSHDHSKSFALCAGSAAVLAELDDNANVNQRFFRARPSATSVHPTTSFYNHSTSSSPVTPDSKARSLSHFRSNPHLNMHHASPTNEFGDNGSPRTWSSRDRIKAVTSVSISPNGRFLAVGETGYSPRVLIFSTARDASPDVPLSILHEHTFGVRSLSFSPDSQYLATLGDVNDGFLFVWAINLKHGSARLHSANKCTSFVRDMCWMGQSLVTTGVRHVKVWRLPAARPISPTKPRLVVEGSPAPNPAPKALSGRNCLLGALGDSTFSCVRSISDQEAVVGTESGAVCLLDDREGSQKLHLVKHVGFGITSLTVDFDQEAIWLAGRGRRMQRLSFAAFRSPSPSTPISPARSERGLGDKKSTGPAISCMGSLSSHLVTVEATREVHVYPMDALNEDGEQDSGQKTMPAHRDPVLGIRPLKLPNDSSTSFFTWSRNGSVNFWDAQGRCQDSKMIELEQLSGEDEVENELKVLRAAENAEWFVSGDKFGVLRILTREAWTCTNEARAHGGEITDIALQSTADSFLVASCGRDRMVQLFRKGETSLQLIQTMDDHVGAVGQISFMNDGERLLSSSADRTVLIRERATRDDDGETSFAYLISKVITLKASPVSMTFCPDDSNVLFLSTVDRWISRFDIPSGRQLHTFRPSDPEANDAVIMGSLTVTSEVPGQSPKLLVGVSSTDKSIRVYDLERDQLLTGEFGHTEGVSDVLLLDDCDDSSEKSSVRRTLVSAGMDGILMIWNLSVQSQPTLEVTQTHSRDEEECPAKELTAAKPPLRKVLSRSELAGFQRPDNPLATPTPVREHSPTLLRKTSKMSLVPSSVKENSVSETPSPPNRHSPTSSPHDRTRRSPSPVSPKSKTPTSKRPNSDMSNRRRTSLDFRTRSKATGRSEFGSLDMSTEQVCRTLRAYRKKLNGSSQRIQAQKELERELNLTLRVVSARMHTSDESAETETDSSGKDMENKGRCSSIASKTPRLPRHMPSTPLLRHKGPRQVSRSRSYSVTGE